MRAAVERVLDDIRPSVAADGGQIELVSVEDGIANIRLSGTCTSCPARAMTLAMTVEPLLKERVPGLKSVLLV